MSKNQLYKNILEETYLATAQGRIEDFKSHLAADVSSLGQKLQASPMLVPISVQMQ